MALPSNEVLAEYLQSPTWSNSRDLLKLHPELLDPAVDELVERMIGYARDEHSDMGRGELEQQLGFGREMQVDGLAGDARGGCDAAEGDLSERRCLDEPACRAQDVGPGVGRPGAHPRNFTP